MLKTFGTKLSFTATETGVLKSDNRGLEFTWKDGLLKGAIYYDFRETPLQLTAQVHPGDLIEILILPYRIEISVNGTVEEEEWPIGTCRYQLGDPLKSDVNVTAQKVAYSEQEEPSAVGSFQNAQGWRPQNNVFVGDCMPYSTADAYHVIYLKDRHHHKSKWGYGAHQWEHISTKDFVTWSIHPTAVKITEQWEGSICTGSWMQRKDTQYLFYTVRTPDCPAPIRRSISKDGYHYEKDEAFSFTLSKKYERKSARDPKVVWGKDGQYHMFLTTSLIEGDRGCLAHLTSSDLDHWEETDPIYISPDQSQPECPDYIQYNGYYYLIFSHYGIGQYLYSDQPFGNWKSPADPVIPCKTVPKGAVWNGKIVFAGFESADGCYAGTMTFREAIAAENGELIFL